MKIVGVVKSIVGTDAVIAIDEDGNQRAIFPGDTLYDNEKLLELSGVQVNVEPVTVADAQKKSEHKGDKEVASLQDALLNGKDISELEETAAGGNAGGGNASSDGVSLGAASFVASGHESSIHADASAYSQVTPASVAGVSNVSGGAEEFVSSLETLTVANELLNPQPTPAVSETPVAITPATPGEVVAPSTPSVETPAEPTGKAENPIIGTEEFHLTSFVDDRSFKKGWTANYSWGPNDYEGDLLNFTHPTHGNRLTNDNTPVLSGKATPGAKITIYDNKEAEVGSGVADKDGNWSIATSKLKDGNHILEVEAHSGTTGELIGKFVTPEIVVDATLIDYSVDRRPYDYSDYAFEYSTHIAADKNPTFGGKTEPNTLVKMTASDNNYVIETFKTSDSEGNYDISIPGLKAGTYVIDVEAIDDAGNITFVPDYDWSNAHTWDFTNLDKSPYDFTMSIMDNVGEKQGDLMLDDKPITDDNILTFSGTGTPGAKVVLYEDHLTVENTVNNWTDSKPFAEVTVGADGRWSYTPDSAFLNTRYGFAGKQIDTVDGQTVTYKLTKGVLVDADIPTAEDMTVHSKLALTDMVIDSDDPGLLYHLTKSPLIDLEERITDFTPTFIGTSEPFANIKIEAKGTYSGDLYSNLDKLVTLYTKADEKGNWKVESDKELGLFDHEVKVSTVSDSGAVLSSLDPIDFMMPTRALHTDPFAAL